MTIAEIMLLDYDAEIAGARRTLERIPEKDPQWKLHEKSMPMCRLALHVATLPRFGTKILTSSGMDMATETFPPLVFESTAKTLSELDQSSAELRSVLAACTDEDLRGHWKFSFGGKVIADGPKMVLYRTMFFNHMVHHRAQLGVCLRLLDIPVPGLYGPSADEPFDMSKL